MLVINEERMSLKKGSFSTITETTTTTIEGPDGGFWAWIVALGSFLANGIIFGVINCFGILFQKFQDTFADADTKDATFLTSCVGSTCIGMTFCFSFVASILTDRYGVRKTAVVGGCLAFIGMFLSSFAQTFTQLYITYGVILGIGSSLAYTPSLVILGHYFTRRLGIVNGVVTAGSSVFTMMMGVALKAILEQYGLRDTLRILSGLMVLLVFAGLTFIERRPPPGGKVPHDNEEAEREQLKFSSTKQPDLVVKEKLVNMAIWSNQKYIIWVIAIPVALFGYFVPYVHLVKHVADILPESNGELLVTTLGASSGIGRIVFGNVSDLPGANRTMLQQLAFVSIGVLTLLLIFAKNFYVLVAICVGLGLSDGCFISLLGPIAFDLVGQSGASQAIGFLLAFCSIPLTVGPPAAGYLYDLRGNYSLAFICAGVPPFLGALLMMPITLDAYRKRKQQMAA